MMEAYLDAQKEAKDASDDPNKIIERLPALKKANMAHKKATAYMDGNVSLITGAYPFMHNDNYLRILKGGAVFYLFGLFFVGVYILKFIYYLPT
jgi:hypothetical protein